MHVGLSDLKSPSVQEIFLLNAKLMVLQKPLLNRAGKTQLLLRSTNMIDQQLKKKKKRKVFFFPLLLQRNDSKGHFIPLWEAPAKWCFKKESRERKTGRKKTPKQIPTLKIYVNFSNWTDNWKLTPKTLFQFTDLLCKTLQCPWGITSHLEQGWL